MFDTCSPEGVCIVLKHTHEMFLSETMKRKRATLLRKRDRLGFKNRREALENFFFTVKKILSFSVEIF